MILLVKLKTYYWHLEPTNMLFKGQHNLEHISTYRAAKKGISMTPLSKNVFLGSNTTFKYVFLGSNITFQSVFLGSNTTFKYMFLGSNITFQYVFLGSNTTFISSQTGQVHIVEFTNHIWLCTDFIVLIMQFYIFKKRPSLLHTCGRGK